MARDFSKDTANYLSLGASAIGSLLNGAGAFSIHVWTAYDTLDTGAANNQLVSWGIGLSQAGGTLHIDKTGANAVLRFYGRGSSADAIQNKIGSVPLSSGVYYSLGVVVNIGGDSITPYVSGAADGGGAVTFIPAVYTHSATAGYVDRIGTTYTTIATASQFDGRIAEVAIWLADIGAAGFASLGKGYSPLSVAPASLALYMPLIGQKSPETCYKTKTIGTITGTVAAATHPRIIYPHSRPARRYTTAVAAPIILSRRAVTGRAGMRV